MRHYNIVLAVIEQDGNYLMQRRANHPKVGAGGLIGFFGGKIDSGEDAFKALCREVKEETTLQPKSEELTRLGQVSIEMNHVDGNAKVEAEAFRINVPSDSEVQAREWELVKMPFNQVKTRVDELTPATKAVFKEILWR